MKTDPVGIVRYVELLRQLKALALARPEWGAYLGKFPGLMTDALWYNYNRPAGVADVLRGMR